jgi:hypothetical protein
MQTKIYIIFLLMLFGKSSFALTRGDVQIIEARENIQYLGQKITTDYFLLYKRPNDLVLKNKFQENIKEIERNIEEIRNSTQNPITINILNFYAYRLEYIKKLPLEEPKHHDAKIILSASKYFLEGARSISKQHQYKSSKEETMLVHCKELKYLVESVSQYYMAFQIGLNQSDYEIEMQQAIQSINKNLKNISNYHYPYRLKSKLQKIQHIWRHNQIFFKNLNETSFTNLLLSSNSYLKTLLINLETYHKQNL